MTKRTDPTWIQVTFFAPRSLADALSVRAANAGVSRQSLLLTLSESFVGGPDHE
jgi:hypothetical protein